MKVIQKKIRNGKSPFEMDLNGRKKRINERIKYKRRRDKEEIIDRLIDQSVIHR